ncbi:hypothetical protein J7E49_21870 [Variovorax paradoxus]|nr:hypothetical protein [Variovorax paradoxus]
MDYKHFYRTNDLRMPTVHVLVTSSQHVQDLKKHHVCIQRGDLARADSVYLKASPMPESWLGQVFVPVKEQDQPVEFYGGALVFCFETESEMRAFCEKSGAIEATFYQQIPA